MSEDTEHTSPAYANALYGFLRKLVVIAAVTFVLYGFLTQSYRPAPPQPTSSAQKTAAPESIKESTSEPSHEPARLSREELALRGHPASLPTPAVKQPIEPAAAQTIEPTPPAPSNPEDNKLASLQQRLDALEAKLQTTEEAMTALREAQSQAVPASEVNAGKERITQLEAQLTQQTETTTALQTQLGDLQTLKTNLHSIQTEHSRRISALTAFGILKNTLIQGESFTSPLERLYALLPEGNESREPIVKALDQIKPYAKKGIPTLEILQNQFHKSYTDALDASNGNSAWKKNISSLIRIRKEGEQHAGSDDQSILARTEVKANERDIKGALKELETASPAVAEAFANWRENAEAYVKSREILNDLQLSLTSSNTSTTTPSSTPSPEPFSEPGSND